MSDATLLLSDGTRVEVLALDLELPLRGVWTAIAEVPLDSDLPTGGVTLELGAENAERVATVERFVGTVRPAEGGTFEGRARLFVVGGGGALTGAARVRDYAGPVEPADVLAKLLPAGEGLSGAAPGDTLEHWHVGASTVAQAISLLADRLAVEWRVLDTGLVQLAVDTWPDQTSALGFRTSIDREARVIHARPEAATLRPGVTVLGERIRSVRYLCASPKGLSVELGYGDERGEFRRAVEAVTPPELYRRTYAATVEAQAADDTLEVTADDAAVGGLSAVPFRCGIPGARVAIPSGSRVRLAFEGGSPERPYATGLDQDPSAAAGVVRVDDAGEAGVLRLENAPSPAPPAGVFSYKAPGALVFLPFATIATVQVAPSPADVSLATLATEGSTEVRLRR